MLHPYYQWEEIHFASISLDYNRLKSNLSKENVNSLVKAHSKINISCDDENQTCFEKIQTKCDCFKDTGKIKTTSSPRLDSTYGNNALMLMSKFNPVYKRTTPEYIACENLLREYGINLEQRDSKGNKVCEESSKENSSFFQWTKDEDMKLKLEEYINRGMKIEDIYDGENEKLSSISLVQWCCKKGFTKSIEYMIEQDINFNKTITKNKKHPILYLLKHPRLYKRFLQDVVIIRRLEMPPEVLVKAIKLENDYLYSCTEETFKYLDNYLTKQQSLTFIDSVDRNGRTALHYAALSSLEKYFCKLLEYGSSLTVTDNHGKNVLDLLRDPRLLRNHFDSCIEYDIDDFEHKSFNIKIDYKTLMTQKINKTQTKDDIEAGIVDSVSETGFLQSLLNKNLHSLLNHPVVELFIFIKWRKLQRIFWFYFLLNMFACFLNYSGTYFYDENDKIRKRIYFCFYSSLLLHFVTFFMELTIYRRKCWRTLPFIITCCLMLSIIGNLIYAKNSPKNYNILVCLSSLTFLTTFKVFLLLQVHPSCTLHVLLLRKTIHNFMKIMCFYLLPVLAFSLCFHLIDENKTKSFPMTIFDTIVSFSGNLNPSDVDKYHSNPIFGRIVYIVFIFIVVIVLNNLLSALAINDLTQIYKEASYVEKRK